MIIQINDQYRITNDPNNVIIQEKKIKKESSALIEQEEYWANVSYHPNLLSACIKLLDLVAMTSEAESVETLLNELKKMRGEILIAVGRR